MSQVLLCVSQVLLCVTGIFVCETGIVVCVTGIVVCVTGIVVCVTDIIAMSATAWWRILLISSTISMERNVCLHYAPVLCRIICRWGYLLSVEVCVDTPLWATKCIFPSQANLHTLFLNLLFPCTLWPPLLPFTINLKIQCPSQVMTILSPHHMTILSPHHMTILSPHHMTMLSPHHMTIPTNTVFYGLLIYCFT